MKKYIKIIILLIFLLFLIFLYINKQNLPVSIFQIQTGSMIPKIDIGEIVILFKGQEYRENEIITYKVDDIYFVTHRIVRIEEKGYITKGDYNNAEDDEIVEQEQIIGKVIMHSKVLGKIYKYRFFIIIILILFLVLL